MRSLAILHGSGWSYRTYSNLLHSVKTGENAFEHTFGMGLFEYLEQHPVDSAVFQAALTDLSKWSAADVLEAYDFSEFQTFADIGGGEGLLLATSLRAYPSLR